VSQQVTSGTGGAGPSASDEDAETISRTLLLAQRTADNTMARANADAESITVKARVDATTVIDNARSMADKLLDEARLEARRSGEGERIKVENEVQALLARRDFLIADVDHLEHHLGAQRERLRDAAVSIQELIERVPGGLGEMRRPLLSASAETVLPSSSPGADASPATAEEAEVEADDAGNAPPYNERNDDAGPDQYAYDSLIDATPSQMAGTDSNADDDTVAVMRLDLGSLNTDQGSKPNWSAAGDDPLIVGDELQ
jgi:hypothetical protein